MLRAWIGDVFAFVFWKFWKFHLHLTQKEPWLKRKLKSTWQFGHFSCRFCRVDVSRSHATGAGRVHGNGYWEMTVLGHFAHFTFFFLKDVRMTDVKSASTQCFDESFRSGVIPVRLGVLGLWAPSRTGGKRKVLSGRQGAARTQFKREQRLRQWQGRVDMGANHCQTDGFWFEELVGSGSNCWQSALDPALDAALVNSIYR